MTTYETLPVFMFINQFKTYEDFKNEVSQPEKYNLSLKENEDICMLYYNTNNNITEDNSQRDAHVVTLEISCRSAIIEKSTLKIISTQFNKILYNEDSIAFLKDRPLKNAVIQKCYEGTLLLVFHHNNRWYVTTRRCLDARESTWVDGKSYYELFTEAVQNKFTFDDLNTNYCYQFILVHYRNKNIVSYDWLGNEYKELFHNMTTHKYTLNEVEHKLNNVKYIGVENFNTLDEINAELKKVSDANSANKKITLEGYVLRYYENEMHTGPYILLKLQTGIYDRLMKMKPNNSNLHQGFLELYQNNNINEFLPYFTRYSGEVVRRINNSMKTLSTEILNLYHMTRGKKNAELYTILPEQYKRILYEIHGLYISNRQQQQRESNNTINTTDNTTDNTTANTTANNGTNNLENIENSKLSKKTINVYDVYHYLKQLPANKLRQLFYDRYVIINNGGANKFTFINTTCIYTMTQSILMYKHIKNPNK